MTAARRTEVHANGLRFACLEEGEGPLVLLAHGFPDTAHSWDAVRPALAAAGFRAVSPFTRGYAPTEVPADAAYDSDTLGRDLCALVEALGEERAILVGHDWGATAGYSAAALTPERFSLLVTIAVPHPASVIPTPRVFWGVRHFFTLRRRRAADVVRRDDFAYIDELVRRWSPGWQVPADATAAVKAAFREPGSLEAALGYYRALQARVPPAQRQRISVPTVAFVGEQDLFSAAAFERARRRFTGPYELVSMPGGHFMHREHPERFNSELLAVLRRHASAQAA
jgi:pimeloyl-ACP methyl ester carboxylesterase